MLRAFTNLNGIGKVLVSIGVALGACLILGYTVVTFSSSSLLVRGTGVVTGPREGVYQWEGGSLLLDREKNGAPTTCTVRPDNGEERQVPARPVNRSASNQGLLVEPWFTGSATVTCVGSGTKRTKVNVYSGRMAELKLLSASSTYSGLGLAIVAVPVGLGFLVGRRKTASGESPPV